MELNLFYYYFSLVVFYFILKTIARSIYVPFMNKKDVYSPLSLVLSLIVITTIISFYYSGFKTINYVCFLLLLYFFKRKYLILRINRPFILKKEMIHLFILSSLFLVQFLLFFFDFELSYPSDDIVLYGKIAQDLVLYGQENTSGILNQLYPTLFNGTSNYHFFELWLAGGLANFFNLSYGYTLIFIVYPLFLFVYTLLLFELVKFFLPFSKSLRIIITICLFFIGPVYFGVYESIFNDGNLTNTTVFSITGFNLQSLPFSYYGQKHLTTYVFLLASLLSFFTKRKQLVILFAILSCVASFGLFIGVFVGLFAMVLFNKSYRTAENLFIVSSSFLLIIGFYQLTNQSIASEIKEQTFYFNEFGKYLNWKGEIARALSKVLVPFIWYAILYFPFLIPLFFFKKTIIRIEISRYTPFFVFISFAYLAGSLFTIVLQGLNSDQFLTNLLPLFNLAAIVLIIFYLKKLNSISPKFILVFFFFAIFLNMVFVFNSYKSTHYPIEKMYGQEFSKKVENLIKDSNPLIGYLLEDSIIKKYPPINWYPYRPGKRFILTHNLNQFVNLNYPFNDYIKSSSSLAYSSENQMKYFIKEQIDEVEFYKFQREFILNNGIKYIFASNIQTIPEELKSLVKDIIVDSKTGICFLVLQG